MGFTAVKISLAWQHEFHHSNVPFTVATCKIKFAMTICTVLTWYLHVNHGNTNMWERYSMATKFGRETTQQKKVYIYIYIYIYINPGGFLKWCSRNHFIPTILFKMKNRKIKNVRALLYTRRGIKKRKERGKNWYWDRKLWKQI